MKKSVLVALCLMVSGASHAGCGAAFCSSGNDWLTLTQGVTPGWRVWGQVEYINQEQLMEGTRNTSREEINMHHEEIKTINRNFLLGMDYGFSPEWSMGVVLPYSNREHAHIHNHKGVPYYDSWQFDEIGDARLKLRYQPVRQHVGDLSWALNGGLKLPTGKINVRNGDGDEAERSLQPGTGTTDLLFGGSLAYAPLNMPGTLFGNLSLQLPLNEKDNYRPGWRTVLQAGWQYPVSSKLDVLLQANMVRTGHDRGENAEPDETGRTEVAVVPGFAYAWSKKLIFNAQIELPVYRKINGVQLVHDYALLGGFSLMLD